MPEIKEIIDNNDETEGFDVVGPAGDGPDGGDAAKMIFEALMRQGDNDDIDDNPTVFHQMQLHEEEESEEIYETMRRSQQHDGDDNTDEEEDETLAERLFGLTEMLPEKLCKFTSGMISFSFKSSKWLFQVGRVGLWVVASTATILALPVMFESERNQMEEQHLMQQRQILLGPNAAMSGQGSLPGMLPGGLPPIPAR